jgi:hypothetical protein
MSHYDSSRAGSAGPSFLHRLASAAPTEYGVNDSVDMRTESEAGDMDVDMDRRPGQAGQAGQGLKVFEAADLDAGPEEAELDDLRRLARVWVRERGVLAVLGWEGDLLDAVLDKLEQQVGRQLRVWADACSRRWLRSSAETQIRLRRSTSASCSSRLRWSAQSSLCARMCVRGCTR